MTVACDEPRMAQANPGPIDPRRDIEAMEAELLLADLISVEQRLERLEKDLKKRKIIPTKVSKDDI